eukprot:402595-Amorphochlora_amoeboformis.AAC.1
MFVGEFVAIESGYHSFKSILRNFLPVFMAQVHPQGLDKRLLQSSTHESIPHTSVNHDGIGVDKQSRRCIRSKG